MKRLVLVFAFLSMVWAAAAAPEWKSAKGIYYFVVEDISKGKDVTLPFNQSLTDTNFSVVIIGKGNGNFDIDAVVYNSDGTISKDDVNVEPLSVITTILKGQNPIIKVLCTSGRGKAIIYAGDTGKVLKMFAQTVI